jgi:hypothetical protein
VVNDFDFVDSFNEDNNTTTTVTDSFNEDNDTTTIRDSFNQDNDGVDNSGGTIYDSAVAGDDIENSFNSDDDTAVVNSFNTDNSETNIDASDDDVNFTEISDSSNRENGRAPAVDRRVPGSRQFEGTLRRTGSGRWRSSMNSVRQADAAFVLP